LLKANLLADACFQFRQPVAALLQREFSTYQKELEVNTKSITNDMGSSSFPAAAAALGIRINDNIRTAIAILERTTFN
jgi:hypothetical protein